MKIAQTKPNAAESGKQIPSRTDRLGGVSHVESLTAPAWRLPGGVRLAEYALRGGFVASSLLVRVGRDR
jgi:hypothetical protein